MTAMELAPARWPTALLVACLTAAAGGALGLPVTLWVMKVLHVSRFEGNSDYAAVFIWTPLAMLTGFVVGWIVTFSVDRAGIMGFVVREGIALLIVAALIAAAGGLAYVAADHPPRVDGRRIEVQFQLRVPTKGRSIEEVRSPASQFFDIRFLVAGDARTNDAHERWDEAQRTDEFIMVPVRGVLRSREAGRVFTAGGGGESWQVFGVPLPPSPDRVEEAWSAWAPAERRWDGSALAPEDRYWMRYRVQFSAE